jgi:hypothetical protein
VQKRTATSQPPFHICINRNLRHTDPTQVSLRNGISRALDPWPPMALKPVSRSAQPKQS